MNDQGSAETIRRRMAGIRQRLGGEVTDIAGSARQLTDWRHYVKAFPLASMSIAATLGYCLVPKRSETFRSDAGTFESSGFDSRPVVEQPPRNSDRPGVIAALAGMTGTMLMRAGLAYAGQKAGSYFAKPSAGEATDDVEAS